MLTFPVQYSIDSNIGYSDQIGIHSLRDVYLHRSSGLCLVRGHTSDWPISIRESGIDNYNELFLRSSIIKKINQIDTASCTKESFPVPAYVFNIFQQKRNYWHFVIDNLSRLIVLLSSVKCKVLILHLCHREGFIGQYFDLIERSFDCTFYPVPSAGSDHILLTSPVLFLEDTFRRNNCSVEFYRQNIAKLAKDRQLTLLALDRDDLYETHKTDRYGLTKRFDHMLDKSSRHRRSRAIYKNTAPWYGHSQTSMQSVFHFGEIIVKRHNAVSDRKTQLLIYRDPSVSGKRNLKTQDELLAAFPSISPIDFAGISVEQQIISSYNCCVLIGVTGAGLSNAIFMRPKSLVIEIAPLGYSIPATGFVEDLCVNRNLMYERIYSTPLDQNQTTSLELSKLDRVLTSYNRLADTA